MVNNFDELVGPTLVNNKGQEEPTSSVLQNKKYVMLYFSAHWCPPCRAFTPRLAEAYNAHSFFLQTSSTLTTKNHGSHVKGEGVDEDIIHEEETLTNEVTSEEIEIIFVSLDSVLSAYEKYRATMPWYSVPHSNLWKLNIKHNLSEKYHVKSIPTLIVLNVEGEVIEMNGTSQYKSFFKDGNVSPKSSGCITS